MRDLGRGVILMSGTQGAGKSTIAEALAARFERGVHVEADALDRFIVSGRSEPQDWVAPEPVGSARAEIELRARNAALLANSFFEAGYVVVVSEIVVGRAFEILRGDIRARPLVLVNLVPSLDVVRERVVGRGKREPFEPWSPIIDQALRESLVGVGMWIDSSLLSVGETVDEILRRLWGEGCIGD